MNKIATGLVALLVIFSAITMVEAGKQEKTIKSFLDGKSKKEIEDTISKFSTTPMLVFVREYGITSIQGKKVDPEKVLTPDGQGGGSPQAFVDRPVDADPAYWNNEPSISAKPNSTSVVVSVSHKYPYSTWPYIRCAAYRSYDNGVSWSNPVFLPIKSDNYYCSDPVVRWAPDSSRVYASYMSYGGTGPSRIVVTYSTNNGASWSSPTTAMTAASGDLVDKPWMDVHSFWNNGYTKNKVYVSATYFGASNEYIVFTRSLNYAASFEGLQTLATSDYDPVIQGSRPIGGKSYSSTSGDVLVCWYDSGTDGWLVGTFDEKCRTSTSYGASSTWGPTVTASSKKAYEVPYYLASGSGAGTYHRWWGTMFPSILITPDGANGVAHMVFASDPTADGTDYDSGDIWYTSAPRVSGGYTNWAVARSRVDDGWYSAGYPTITAKKTTQGTVLKAAWEDHRQSPYYTPNNEDCGNGYGEGYGWNCYYDIYESVTEPGGMDWNANPNRRLTDISSISDKNFIGDYIDATTNRITSSLNALVIWTDRRDLDSVWYDDDDIYSDKNKVDP